MSKSTSSKEDSNSSPKHNHSKSLFQEDPQISGPPNLKFFGTLGSLPSFSLLTVTCSGSDVNKKSSGSPSDQLHGPMFRENHGRESSTILNKVDETKQTASSRVTNSNRSALEEYDNLLHSNLTNNASSSSKQTCTENEGRSPHDNLNYGRNAIMPKATIVESWIRNIQRSINLIKAKNAPLFEEVEEQKPVVNDSTSHMPTPNQSDSFSAGIDNVRRVIVCDSSFSSVPKVIMCDNNCEAVSYNEDSDSENNRLSPPLSAANKQTNIVEEGCNTAPDLKSRMNNKEEQLKRNFNFMHSGRVPAALLDLSFPPVAELAGGADDAISRTHSNATTMETSSMNSHTTQENEKTILSETDRCSTCSENDQKCHSHDSLVSAKSSFYEPAGHVHTCCMAGMYTDHNLQPPAPIDPVCSLNFPCGHVPLQRSVTPLRQMFDSSGESHDQLEEFGNADSCGHMCEACAMNAAAHENCVSKRCPSKMAMKLKTLEEEMDRLSYELRQRDCKILQLQNQLQCIQSEKEQKPVSSQTTILSKTQNKEEKLHELSNSISVIQRSIELYCSCLKGDPYNLEVQLHEMERGVEKIKEEFDKMRNDRLEAEAMHQTIQDCNRLRDQNLESSEKTEAISCGTSSQQMNVWSPHIEPQLSCQNHGVSADGSCGQCETASLKTQAILDLQSDLNRKIGDLQIKVSMLKAQLDRQRCCTKESSLNKGAQSLGCCCKYCGADQSANLENQKDPLCKINELQHFPLLHSMEVRHLAQILSHANSTQAVLSNDLESKTCQVEELKNKLMKSESKISNLLDKLKEEMKKDHTLCDLQNQVSLRAGGSTEEQECNNYECKIRDLEEKLTHSENVNCSQEKAIKDLQKTLESCQMQISDYQAQLKSYEEMVSVWREKSEWCSQKYIEMEQELQKQLDCREMKIVNLESELKDKDESCNRKLSEMESKYTKLLEANCMKIAILEQQAKKSGEACGQVNSEFTNDFTNQVESCRRDLACLEDQLKEKDDLCSKKISDLNANFEAKLDCSRKKIASLKSELEEKDAECKRKLLEMECKQKGELESSRKKIASLEAALSHKDVESCKKCTDLIKKREKEFECERKYIVRLEAELKKKDEEYYKKCSELANKCEDLECSSRYIASLEAKLKKKDEECSKKIAEMMAKYKDLECKMRCIEKLESELKKKDEQCRKKCSQVASKCEEDLECSRRYIAKLEAELKQTEELCSRKLLEMANKCEQDLECNRRYTASIEAELKKKDEECRTKCSQMCMKCEKELECHRKRIATLEAELKKKDEECTKKCTEICNKCQMELDCLRKHITTLEAELKKKDEECSQKCTEMCNQCEKELECARKLIADSEAEVKKKEEECVKKCAEMCIQCQKELECAREKISSLEAELRKNEEIICTLSNEVLNCETKNKELQEKLKCKEDELNACQKHIKAMEETQNSYTTQSEIIQRQIQCVEDQLAEVTAERDLLVKEQKLCALEVKDLKKNKKKLENANYCLAREISAEVERLKVDLMVKLHNFCPLITSLEMTRTELQEALALFEDAERRCCSLNDKLNQTNEELQALKAMKQSASKASKLLHNCSEKSLENQALLAEACEDLSSLNSEKTVLRSAVESLMIDNEEKDKQLCDALREMEELKKEIDKLKKETDEKQCY